MRQRHVNGIDEKLAGYADLILRPATDCPSVQLLPSGRPVRWYQRTSQLYQIPEGYERIYAEFGCGRGRFISAMAAGDPEALYIGIEGCKTIVAKAMAKAKAADSKNIRFIDSFINDAGTAFEEDSLSGLFLNFSDPWPKDRHEDRRLTAPAKAKAYLRILKPGGFVLLKTDGEAFFKYSLASFAGAGFQIAGCVCEIAKEAGCDMTIIERAIATPTEYEERFRALDQPIYRFLAYK